MHRPAALDHQVSTTGHGSTGQSSDSSSGSESPKPTLINAVISNSDVIDSTISTSKKHIIYRVDVTYNGKTWTIYKRYSEFAALHETLRKQVPSSNLKLPGKKLFGNNFSMSFITIRKLGLNDFMQKILSDNRLSSHPSVVGFLALDQGDHSNEDSMDVDHQLPTFDELDLPASSSEAGSPSPPPNGQAPFFPLLDKAIVLGPSEKPHSTPDDFEFLKVIGKGSFGKVLLARHKEGKVYAVKVLQKKMILKRNEKSHIMCERNVLLKNLNHPFLVGLHYSFQSRDKLYFVLDYVNGGEMFFHLQKERCFPEPRARFYAAEITSALGYLHSQAIVYRDLKPENILLDQDGHVVLTDFGLCKDGLREKDTTSTFCGTPEYLAPEVLRKEAYDRCVDWWCLGAVLYEMIYGLPPFYSRDTSEMYENILTKPVRLRSNITLAARNILEGLLQKDKRKRLGFVSDVEEIKGHEFFKPINWADLESKNLSPPFNPNVKGALDLKNIDPEFTREAVPASVVRPQPMSSMANGSIPTNAFEGFSYVSSGDNIMNN
ncbi:Serine/threonine-protein kinase Sgk3 [Halotydeus destructor]|nr:Serine/threonine-protein kinase Sgk3 [Halotydeus destructor]